MIDLGTGRPGESRMAFAACIGCVDMRCVFARSGRAVMATVARTCNAGMIEDGRDPSDCSVTIVTCVRTGDVRGRLACRSCAVMTA